MRNLPYIQRRLLIPCTLALLWFTAAGAVAQPLIPENADNEDLADSFQRADWVSLVSIESVGNLINPSLSFSGGMQAVEAHRYRAITEKSWKGETSTRFKFDVELRHCHSLLRPQQSYVIFGVVDRTGNREVLGCQDAIALEQAGGVMPLLETLGQH